MVRLTGTTTQARGLNKANITMLQPLVMFLKRRLEFTNQRY